MPIYEFQCLECRHRFQDLMPNSSMVEAMICPKCSSRRVGRLMSRFRMGRSEDARLEEVADSLASNDLSESPTEFGKQMKEIGRALDEDISGEMEAIFDQEIAPDAN